VQRQKLQTVAYDIICQYLGVSSVSIWVYHLSVSGVSSASIWGIICQYRRFHLTMNIPYQALYPVPEPFSTARASILYQGLYPVPGPFSRTRALYPLPGPLPCTRALFNCQDPFINCQVLFSTARTFFNCQKYSLCDSVIVIGTCEPGAAG
jgi:hypothetical protein